MCFCQGCCLESCKSYEVDRNLDVPKHSVTHGITDVSKFNQKMSVTDTLLFN